jgi:hypothetical protein
MSPIRVFEGVPGPGVRPFLDRRSARLYSPSGGIPAMIDGLKVVVVMPAYNAEQTLKQTYLEIPKDVVDDIVLVDDRTTPRPSWPGAST